MLDAIGAADGLARTAIRAKKAASGWGLFYPFLPDPDTRDHQNMAEIDLKSRGFRAVQNTAQGGRSHDRE
jgi:hypothetical protein